MVTEHACVEDQSKHRYKGDGSGLKLSYLRDNADAGCDLCQLVLAGFESIASELADEDALDQILFNRQTSVDWPDRTLTFMINNARADGRFNQVRVEFVCDTTPRTLYPPNRLTERLKILPGKLVPPSAQESIAEMKGWIDTCIQNHSSCRIEQVSFLPSRVLDVGSAHDSAIRLIETKHVRADYVALSHRWGAQQLLTTTRATLEARKSCIKPAELSKTFHDAAVITRRLGLRYLWIDSLCIIQDDSDDWHMEASRMANIYENSYVTIAADTAEGVLLDELASRKKWTGSISLHEAHEVEAWLHVRSPLTHEVYTLGSLEGVMSGFPVADGYPLLQRAWCFQERLLATRIVHFTHQELVFECKTTYECECGAMKHNLSSPLKPMYAKLMRPSSLTTPHIAETPWEGWKKMASPYILKGLTKTQDALPAIAGIASRVQCENLGNYVAGLWGNHLVRGLFWFAAITALKQKDVRTGPTFSWISLTGTSTVEELQWPYLKYLLEEKCVEEKIEIITVDCVVPMSSPYCQLFQASLTIRGKVVAVTLRGEKQGGKNAVLQSKTCEKRVAAFMDRMIIKDLVQAQAFSCLLGIKFLGREGPWEDQHDVKQVCALLIQPTDDGRYERHGCLPHLVNDVDWFQDAEEKTFILI